MLIVIHLMISFIYLNCYHIIVVINMKRNHEFIWFEEIGGKFSGKPAIGILGRGGISFNVNFMRKYFPKDQPKYVKLGYDEDGEYQYIALAFSNDQNTPGAMKLSYAKSNYGWAQCVSFFKKHKINYQNLKDTKFDPEEYEDKIHNKTFVISIRKM